MNGIVRVLLLTVVTLAMLACSKDDEIELGPTELVKIETTLDIKKIWSAKLGGDAEFLRVNLQPAGDGSRIYAASRDGKVSAFKPESGKRDWQTQLDTELSAGPGVGEGLVAVGTGNGLVIALDANTGVERWRADLEGETLAPPVMSGDQVIVVTIDNRLHALRASDGTRRWVIEQSTPRLTMRGSATPAIAGNSVIAGFDNGRLLAVDLDSGNIVWDSMLAPPSGRSDLERLSDVDGLISVVGQDIYASGYQGRVAAVAAESGQILWDREISSYVGVAADWTNVYTTSDLGEVIAMFRRNGTESWRQSSLIRREPTLPVSFNTTVTVGDLEGYLHFFSVIDGVPVARLRLGSKAISSSPVVFADRLYVQSDSGEIAAYAVRHPKPKKQPNAPDIAADEGA